MRARATAFGLAGSTDTAALSAKHAQHPKPLLVLLFFFVRVQLNAPMNEMHSMTLGQASNVLVFLVV